MTAETPPHDPNFCFCPVEDTESGVWKIRIFVDGMDAAIGTSLITRTAEHAMGIADSMDARLDREAWTAFAAKCAGAEPGDPAGRGPD